MKTLNQWTKTELLNLPLAAPEYSDKHYTSILVLGREDLNESGEQVIAIIGVNHGRPVEIAAGWVEFLDWIFPLSFLQEGSSPGRSLHFRSTCVAESGALHVWMHDAKVKVGAPLSHTDISFVADPAL